MTKNILLLCSLVFFSVACGVSPPEEITPEGANRISATRNFTVGGESFAPMDIQKMQVTVEFDLATRTAKAISTIEWTAKENGFAYFLSAANASAAFHNGVPVAIALIKDPDNLNSLRVVRAPVLKGEQHSLRYEFQMPVDTLEFRANGIGFVTSMSDIIDGNYLEAYFPANFEEDAYQAEFQFEIKGNASAHRVFTNGTLQTLAPNRWKIDFPSYFTSSSHYVHITNSALSVLTTNYQGLTAVIPVTIYSKDAAEAKNAMDLIPGLFAELERDYGPYPHASFTAYVTGNGGMEHVGATITSVSALGHELTHSWFARGVMPAEGRSGWIDEAIASWRDYGYQRAPRLWQRPATNLGRFSAFWRFAPRNSYADGRAFMSELDLFFANSGGMKPVLRKFFDEHKYKTVTNADLIRLLEAESGNQLSAPIRRYVFADLSAPSPAVDKDFVIDDRPSLHPRPITAEDLPFLR